MRLPAVEQGREQALEMGVDRLEGGEQPDAAFAIEIADRPAQPVYRLLQFVDLGRVPFALAVEFGEFIGGDQIDRAEPLTLGDQSVVRSRFGRSEEHTSELQSLMRISYAVFCLKKKKTLKY